MLLYFQLSDIQLVIFNPIQIFIQTFPSKQGTKPAIKTNNLFTIAVKEFRKVTFCHLDGVMRMCNTRGLGVALMLAQVV